MDDSKPTTLDLRFSRMTGELINKTWKHLGTYDSKGHDYQATYWEKAGPILTDPNNTHRNKFRLAKRLLGYSMEYHPRVFVNIIDELAKGRTLEQINLILDDEDDKMRDELGLNHRRDLTELMEGEDGQRIARDDRRRKGKSAYRNHLPEEDIDEEKTHHPIQPAGGSTIPSELLTQTEPERVKNKG